MTMSNNRTGNGNILSAKSTSSSSFDSTVSVPVDTLFSMQVKALLEMTQKQLQCRAIALALFTYAEPALGESPFLSSKKVLNFNNTSNKSQTLDFGSHQHSEGKLTSDTSCIKHNFDLYCELGVFGKLTVVSECPEASLIGSQNLKRKLEQFVLRAITQEKVRKWFGETSLWCGICQSLQLAEHQLTELSNSRQPILIRGKSGTGKKLAALYAATVHAKEKFPFVDLVETNQSINITAAELRHGLSEAQGGVLYIKEPTSLDFAAWQILKRYCEKKVWDTQVIVAASDECEAEAIIIWLQYHFQSLTLPSFEQRRSDLRFICIQYLLCYCSTPATDFSESIYSELSKSVCFQSIEQVHRCIAKLRQLKRPDLLSVDDLRGLFADEVAFRNDKSKDTDSTIRAQQSGLVIPLGKLYSSQFAESLNPSQEHPAILKALTYMAEHYQHSFSLQDLADQAFVSPSHLSFLLKNRFGKSFKGLLIEFRIEKAQEILREFPVRQITQVCIDVGFLDLSHFEKTFKKITGLTPRKYRDKHKQKLSISLTY
ncbi:MAG: helix-turn-helix domain-containing protein [Aestuariibacter sp.]